MSLGQNEAGNGGNPVAPKATLPATIARRLGQIALGTVLGLTLVPALLELAALAGDVSAFKYQGF